MKSALFLPTGERAEHFIRWWARVQQRGKAWYIIKAGALFIPHFLLWFVGLQIAYDMLGKHISFEQALSRWNDFSLPALSIWLVALLTGGGVFGWLQWRWNQYLYRMLKNSAMLME